MSLVLRRAGLGAVLREGWGAPNKPNPTSFHAYHTHPTLGRALGLHSCQGEQQERPGGKEPARVGEGNLAGVGWGGEEVRWFLPLAQAPLPEHFWGMCLCQLNAQRIAV